VIYGALTAAAGIGVGWVWKMAFKGQGSLNSEWCTTNSSREEGSPY
jgi:hypothetical protein